MNQTILDNPCMEIKDSEIYPRYTFRLTQADKDWLDFELDRLKLKFNDSGQDHFPVITKNVLIISALRRGLGFLNQRERSNPMQIEKEIYLESTRIKVWEAISNPIQLSNWWQEGMKLEPKIGGEFYEPWKDANGIDQLATGIVEEVIPQKYLQFSWIEKTWDPNQKTICSFELSDIQSMTRLSLIHSGWDQFPAERAAILKNGFEVGWDAMLANLKNFLS